LTPSSNLSDSPVSSSSSFTVTRRDLMIVGATTMVAHAAPAIALEQPADLPETQSGGFFPTVGFSVNGEPRSLKVDTRTTLLDALREHLHLTGTKKGCDHGQCGACTVLVDGRRINSCLTLTLSVSGSDITTIEGLANGDGLSPAQQAFAKHDGFQCGYCTPGQICSATALVQEAKAGQLSQVSWRSANLHPTEMTDNEIRERMSGNICRCGAYPNIVAAVRTALGKGEPI
jgi:xanthine dehydrogenase YagT iron-sulfur-binding subunit